MKTVNRYMIAHGSFFGDRAVAEEWLRQQEQSRYEAQRSEEIRLARKDARSARIIAIIAATIVVVKTFLVGIVTGLTGLILAHFFSQR